MAIKTFKYFDAGVGFKDQAADNITTNGVIYRNGNSLKLYIQNALRNIVTDTQTQTLTNKTIDADLNTISNIEVADFKAGVLNTSTTLAAASNLQVPSALAVKSYVDAGLALQNDASEIAVTPAGTISSTNVQAALQELDGDIQGHITNATGAHAASAISNTPSGNLAATNVQTALNELQSDIDTRQLTLANITLTNAYHLETQASTDSTTTGANASLAAFTSGLVRLTNASLTSLANIPAGANGQILVVFNRTGVAFNIADSSAAIGTAANRILTGTGATLTMAVDSALIFQYDTTTARWQTVGGSGGGATFSDATFTIFDQADNTKRITFDAAGTTGTLTTIQSSQTANRLLTLPDATDTLTANSATQTLTNKTIVAANNTITTAASGNLTSTNVNAALAELQGDIDFNRDANRVLLLDASEAINTWSTGNSATFLASGTISGTLARNTSTPLHGVASYSFTQAAGSLNDWFVSAAQPVDLRFRGQQTFLTFPFQNNGNTTDIQIVVYDATNSAIISSVTDLVPGTNGATSSAIVGVIIPLTCTSIRIGFQVKVLNSGKVFSFDDISLSTDIFSITNVANLTDWQPYTPTFTGFGTPTGIEFQWRQVGGNYEIRGKFTAGTTTAVENRITLPNSATSAGTAIIPSLSVIGRAQRNVATPSQYDVVIDPSSTFLNISVQSAGSTGISKDLATDIMSSGEILSFFASVPIAGLQSYNAATAVPAQQVSSDTIAFAFKATAIDPNVDPVGTFNTYTYAASSNTATIAATAPTQTTSSMNTNGIQIFGRPYNATSTAASPARVDIFIGKGLKSKQVDAYASLAKADQVAYDMFQSSTSNWTGSQIAYSETTGILQINAASDYSGGTTVRTPASTFTGGTATSAYFVFNASKSPSLVTIPNLQQRVAYLSDVKASGTAGGSSVAGFQTRTLNTIVDSTGIVTSLTGNQFTLPAGTYRISGSAPCYQGNRTQSRIRNITDSTNSILGTTDNATTAAYARSLIDGEVVITSSKVFELQQYIQSAVATNGLGVESSSGIGELYSQVTIQKIK